MAGNAVSWKCVLLLLLSMCCLCIDCTDEDPKRTMKTEFHQGCGITPNCSDCSSSGVVYISAAGDTDTLHYIISALGGPPSVVVLRTNTPPNGQGKVSIDCSKLADRSTCAAQQAINIEPPFKLQYAYSVVFTRVFQYNDTSDKADPDIYNINSTHWRVYDFTDFTWEDMKSYSSDYIISLRAKESENIDGSAIVNGSLEFKFHFYDHEERAEKLPHLVVDENTMQMDFTLQKIDAYSSARWVLETTLLTSDDKTSMALLQTKSIDDEYTPGVFQIVDWLGKSDNQALGAFLQWKPVCYIDTPRSRATATKVHHKTLTEVEYVQTFIQSSTANCFPQLKSRRALNFTFGLEKDDGFTKNFTSWTVNLGLGVPPKDKVSTLVIGVISAGLGIPVVLIIFGGLGVYLKKRMGKSQYHKLNDVTRNSAHIQ